VTLEVPLSEAAPSDRSLCFEGFPVIDADTHLSEPHDLWLKNAPAKYRDRVPQVKPLKGEPCWVIDGDKSIGNGANPLSAIAKDGTRPPGFGFLKWRIEDCHPGSWRVQERLEVMDSFGIRAQIVYPNLLGFGGQKAAQVDFELRLVCVQLYNDAMAELQQESGQRLFPMALLPWWDVAEAAREAERAARLGLRGININSDPHTARDADGNLLKDLGDPIWDRLWEVCVAHDLPVNFHIGASEQTMDWYGNQGWPSLDEEHHGALGGAMLFFNNGRVMANIIYSGLLDRFPRLKFVSVESGVGWVPFLLQALDHQYREMITKPRFRRPPSSYFASNFSACFWFERRDISAVIRAVGVENVLFETDFPHPTCLYPVDRVTQALGGLSREEIAKVLAGNAARVYGIALS
jgi:predicted TIM-barrel fold metal-dependent hydrolase